MPGHGHGHVVLFSGCKDNQTSADAHLGGQATGAMTYAFTTTLKKVVFFFFLFFFSFSIFSFFLFFFFSFLFLFSLFFFLVLFGGVV